MALPSPVKNLDFGNPNEPNIPLNNPESTLYKNVHNIDITTIDVTTGLKNAILAIFDVFNFLFTSIASKSASEHCSGTTTNAK